MTMVKYLFDRGWPWTAEKGMTACRKCGGGMFVLLAEIVQEDDAFKIPIHRECVGKETDA